ncbi:MAG: porin family protein [Cytophagales bacterium]
MNLYLKALWSIILIFICNLQGFSQTGYTMNLPNYDEKKMHYGFIIATNYTRFIAKQSSEFLERNDTIKTITPEGSGGFTLGFILNARLYDFLDFRVTPSVGFYQRGLNYEFEDKGKRFSDVQTIESTFIELPVLLKYKSERRRNFRMYFIGGLKPAISTSSKNKDQRPDKLRTNSFDLSLDYGFGCDIYYPLFKFAPEIRFSHGLLNMAVADPHIYSRSLKSLTTHTITLFLNFE